MRNATILAFSLGLALVGACGDDDDDTTTFDAATGADARTTDARPTVDGATGTPDSATSTPDAAASSVELTAGGAFTTSCVAGLGTGGSAVSYGAPDEGGVIKLSWIDDAESMALGIELYASYGAPTAPGTYDITATEADYATCGLCIMVNTADKTFMPVAGSGTITLTDYAIADPIGSDFTGSLTVNMQEVTIDSSTLATTPVAGGCTGALTSSWTGNVVAFPE